MQGMHCVEESRSVAHSSRIYVINLQGGNGVGLCHLGKACLSLLDKSPDLLFQLPSRRFEELVAEILEKQGYEVDLTPASGDGGFDMYAAKKDGLGNFLYLVECKRYTPPNKVGVEIIRAVNGVVQAKQATAGAVVTTSACRNLFDN